MPAEQRRKSVAETFHDGFHKHLSECDQCERNPFDLCEIGALLLKCATNESGKELMEMLGALEK